ncbi:SSL2 DNA or RNA helicases of superfamily II [uncultured Caudovirales phage]|uniref:SSL2 DNA or RNA helicases of superfamily II n=1 Tax=uncultured Caudovirales phage TaxID=2100421 RepID=A0A6J7VKM9_9CAUD|nr:SSL2 DNA or RNA helicases of superfamily II [uncultured Caudovirales phage]CAB4241237.1 SSL2 DNA or RNA helicases of superfamily II [uncultured Caudovirales phage]CAB5078981.1 SSL2 DNA or RNA helicases of superfamily II [uncultured Caudovirales phage]
MRLRERQVAFKDRAVAALDERGNTLGVAPTGAGKTVMLSAISGHYIQQGAKGLIIQHRDELVVQNRRTFQAVNPTLSTSLYTADEKDWKASATFTMIQTLGRESNLADMPKLDFIAIDEGHHAAAPTYRKTIDRALANNPDTKLLLVTATPNRGDGKSLKGIVDNVSDQITLRELIDARLLVPPRTFVIDIGIQDELRGVKKRGDEFDPLAVEAIMDKQVLNDRIIEEWEKLAGERQTVIFCSTVAHAQHVAQAFADVGVEAAALWGDMGDAERRSTLEQYDKGEIQVITNVAVLTEGWDHQPTSCVILLRLNSYKSTMMQMIGRGLRTVDPERYPGVQKDDCIVLDFGTSLLSHGSIEQEVNLDGRVKDCPACQARVPHNASECVICGYVWPAELEDEEEEELIERDEKERGTLRNFVMTEIDLLNASPFRYENLFNGLVCIASAFEAWAAVVSYSGRWHAIAGGREIGIRHVANSADRFVSMAAADDFLRLHGDKDDAHKTKRWLSLPPTDKQTDSLGINPMQAIGLNRYQAACHLTWKFNERVIRKILEGTQRMAA